MSALMRAWEVIEGGATERQVAAASWLAAASVARSFGVFMLGNLRQFFVVVSVCLKYFGIKPADDVM